MQLKFFQKNKNSKRGITLIEVMVALLFLSTGLIPLLTVIISSINLSTRIKNNLIAANLAQEGVEVTRAIRDKAWMDNALFDRDLIPGNHLVSWDSTSLIPYDPATYVKIDQGTGVYSQTTGVDTIFKRRINITPIASSCNCEVGVTSEITWTEKSQNKTLTVEGHLFNWK